MKCQVCHIEESQIDPLWGVLPCLTCQERRDHFRLPDKQTEFTSQEIKEGRKEYAKSMIVPWRGDTPSQEFIDAYPDQAEGTFGDAVSKAEYVWAGEPGHDYLEDTQ